MEDVPYVAPVRFLNRTIILVSLTSLLTDVSSEMVYPLLPMFVTVTLGASKSALGLIEGVAESIAQVLRVFAGAWSDRIGRRKPLAVGGYAGSAVGKVLLWAAASWGLVFAARVVDRLGKGIRSAPRDALIADGVDPEVRGRAFGFHRAMDTLGAAIGVLVAYAAIKGGYEIRTILLISIVPAGLGVVALAGVREPAEHNPKAREPWRPIATWRALPGRLKAYLAIMTIFTLGNSSNQFLLLRARGLGFDDAGVVLLHLVYTLVYLGASYPAGALSDRVGRRVLLVAGNLVFGATYLGFALAGDAGPGSALMWLLFTVYGLHIGLTEGVEKALLVDLAPRELRATVLGLNATLIGLGLLPASLVAGILWDRVGPAAPFYLGAVLGIATAAALAIALRTTPKP